MYRVVGGVQNYAWGKVGRESGVCLFCGKGEAGVPYAEYWLGTHKSMPSVVEGALLSDRTGDLPYLFKVLSIAKPLSIQIHPSKQQAEYLHSQNPHLYPDNNYKPEMCIAKSKMRLLIGFRPESEMNSFLASTPELLNIVGENDLQTQLFNLYKDESLTRASIQQYCTRINSGPYFDLNAHYPEDPGIFFAMFMNYIELNLGEAIIIHAGVPHCYLEGDCFEAMVCSDNVIRAGLTPKPKDVRTLLEITNYDRAVPNIVYPEKVNENCRKYDSGYKEFQVLQYFGTGDIKIGENGVGLGVVCEGKVCWNGKEFVAGDSFLVEQTVSVEFEAVNLMVCCGNTSN